MLAINAFGRVRRGGPLNTAIDAKRPLALVHGIHWTGRAAHLRKHRCDDWFSPVPSLTLSLCANRRGEELASRLVAIDPALVAWVSPQMSGDPYSPSRLGMIRRMYRWMFPCESRRSGDTTKSLVASSAEPGFEMYHQLLNAGLYPCRQVGRG